MAATQIAVSGNFIAHLRKRGGATAFNDLIYAMKRQAARDSNDKEPSKNAMVTPRTQSVFDTAGVQHLFHAGQAIKGTHRDGC